VRHCPEVLVVRLSIYQEMKNWDLMQTVARNLADLAPDDAGVLINLAYATRRMESIEAARVILICALGKHPNHPTIHYNLACYDCQLGDLESSKQFLDHALILDPGFRAMALKDKDLEPLWGSLAGE